MKIDNKILAHYFLIVFVLNMMAVYLGLRNGVILAVLIVISLSLGMVKGNKKIRIYKSEVLILVFVIYNVISMLLSIGTGFSMSAIISEFSNTILPITFVYFILKLDTKNLRKLENGIIILIFLALVTGIYLNRTLATQSDVKYIEFLSRTYPNFYVSVFLQRPRLTSYFGSVILGTVSLAGIAIAYKRLSEDRSVFSFLVIFILSSVMCFLTLQRSAYLGYIIMNLIIGVTMINKRKISLSNLFYIVVSLLVIVAVTQIVIPDFISNIIERFSDFGGAISERDDSWLVAFEGNYIQLLFGNGFATGGQRAIGISDFTINDGNYFKIIYELGFMGLIIFISMIISIFRRAYKNFNINYIYLSLSIAILIQGIGSNVFTFMINAIVFWISIGMILRPVQQGKDDL